MLHVRERSIPLLAAVDRRWWHSYTLDCRWSDQLFGLLGMHAWSEEGPIDTASVMSSPKISQFQ
jgi:hypothetical protein